jgi:hypothetical protein
MSADDPSLSRSPIQSGEPLAEMNAQRTHVDISFHPATPAPAETNEAATPAAAAIVEPPLEVGPDGLTTAVVAPEVAAVKKDYWTAKVVRREALVRPPSFLLRSFWDAPVANLLRLPLPRSATTPSSSRRSLA